MNINTKLAGGAGIVWVAVNVGTSLSTGQPPAIDASGPEITTYLTDHRGVYLAAAAAFALTLPLLLTFFGELVGRVRTSEDSAGGPLASVAQSGLTAFAVGYGLAYVLTLPFVIEPSLRDAASDDLVRTVYVMVFMVTMIANAAAATMLLAFVVPESVLGAWARGSAGIIAGVMLVASAAGLVSADAAVAAGATYFLLGLWTLGVGIAMVRQTRPAMLSVATPAAA